MKIPVSLTKFFKKLITKLPSFFWSKKDKTPSFFILFTLLVLLFAYVINMHSYVTTKRYYDGDTEMYSDEYIHIDVDLLARTTAKRGFSGWNEVSGGPYQLVIYAVPDVDAEHNEITQKDKDAFVVQESYKTISSAVIKNTKMVTARDELVLDLGDIDLMDGSTILDGNIEMHPLDRQCWAETATRPGSESGYFKGRVNLGEFDLNYEGYLVEGTLSMETTDGLIERYFIAGLPPKGEEIIIGDGIVITEKLLPTLFLFLPMMFMMAAFIAFLMKLIVRIRYVIAFKIQFVLYLLFFYYFYTAEILLPKAHLDVLLALLLLGILQIVLYKIYSKRSYIFIIFIFLGTILAPVIFYYGFNFIATLIFG